MLDFIDKVTVPYAADQRQKLKLPVTHPALAIFDVFASHRCKSMLDKLKEHNIHQVFIPSDCTGELQPLDLAVNDQFKSKMKALFSEWYAGEVQAALSDNMSLANVKVDLHASTVKLLHARWLINALSKLFGACCMKLGFEKAGILDCICE